MCKSVKGAAYFGSSIHVVAAFIFLFWFLFDTVITEVRINLWGCVAPEDDPPKNYNILVHYINLPFKFLYYMCLCVTGIYIFRGVERNSPRVIKFALLVFAIVQIISLGLFIIISLNYWEDDVEPLRPVASRLIDPKLPSHLDDIYSSEESNETYGIQIEVISHSSQPSETSTSSPKLGCVDDFDAMEKETTPLPPPTANLLSESFEFIDENEQFLMSPSPENLVNRPETEEVFNTELQGPTTPPDDEVKAVLENPLDLDLDSTTTTPMPPEIIVIKEVPRPQSKLSHNQLVTVVFQVFLLGFNAVGSIIYILVLILHLTSL